MLWPFGSKKTEKRGRYSIEDDWNAANFALSRGRASAGPAVNHDNALQVTAVYAAVRVISETLASLPLVMYRGRSARELINDSPIYALLHDEPNPYMSSFEWREATQGHVLLRGNSVCYVTRNNAGQPTRLDILNPDKMKVYPTDDYGIAYFYDGEPLTQSEILHIKGMGDGLWGKTPIAYARDAIGLAMATEEHGSRLFSNGTNVGGILKTQSNLSDDQWKRFRDRWTKMQGGLSNSNKPALLEGGMDWVKVGLANDEAQFLETRKFQVTEIARFFRVPPHMLMDLDRATFSNIEHQSIQFVTHTMRPWLVRWEQTLNRSLLTTRQRNQGYYFEFNIDGLLRGDIKSRYEAYSSAISAGWMTRNQARQKENMPPIDGLDEPLTPLNMAAGTKPEEEENG
jgi:HK97 family phage portal protein